MDLGQLAGDLLKTAGEAYIARQLAPTGYSAPIAAQPALNIPFIDVVPEGAVAAAKKKCRRRRRKRLATKSDLGDLAALKAILGNGEAFKMWIATHS